MRGRQLLYPRSSRSKWMRVDLQVDADSRSSGSVQGCLLGPTTKADGNGEDAGTKRWGFG